MLRCYRIRSEAPLTLLALRRCLSHYKTLGVTKESTPAEIKSSYYARAKKCHPDIHPDDELKIAEFLKIQDAYFILSDPTKKRSYDGRSSTTPNYTDTGAHYTHQTSYDTDYANEHGKRTAKGRKIMFVVHKVIGWAFIGWAVIVFVGLFSNRLWKPKRGNIDNDENGYSYDSFLRGQGAGSAPGHTSPWTTRPRRKVLEDKVVEESVKAQRLVYLNKMLDTELAGVIEDKRKRAEEVLENKFKRKIVDGETDLEQLNAIFERKKKRRERKRRIKELRKMIKMEIAKNPLES